MLTNGKSFRFWNFSKTNLGFSIEISIGAVVTRAFAGQKTFAWHRAQWFAPEFHGGKQFEVGHSIGSIARRVNEWIDDTGRPGKYRGDRIEPWILMFVIEYVDNAQRQEAQYETDENGQHHRGQAAVFAFTCSWQSHRF